MPSDFLAEVFRDPTLLKGLCLLAAAKSQAIGGIFLLHFPSPWAKALASAYSARPLAGILLCGARTFLQALARPAAA